MGACGSKPSGCVGVAKTGRRIRRTTNTQSFSHKLNKVEPSHSTNLSYRNPTFQGNSEAWFDLETAINDSEGDDDFYSVQDDMSQIGSGSLSNVVTPRYSDNRHFNVAHPSDPETKSSEPSSSNLETNKGKEVSAEEGNLKNYQLQADDNQHETKDQAHFDKVSSHCVDTSPAKSETGRLHTCGPQTNNCLPCLVCSTSRDEKTKSLAPHSTISKKRVSFKLSFKRREGQTNSALLSHRAILRRPIAGSQIPHCQAEKRMSECWSEVAPNAFRVRGHSFMRDKKKEYAPNYAAFYPFGVDVFLSPRKIDHIARFVELPSIDSTGEIPPILVVNLQMPLYPATIFQNEYDGEGMSIVFYFKLSENYSKELPVQFQENIRRIIDDEVEKIKSFPLDTNAPFRERLKILGRVVNIEDVNLGAAEKKLMNTYNEKPVLSRPQHEFYLGENYFEIDLDIHRFGYIARKGFEAFHDRLKHCVFDFGLTIQGHKAEDLPECMLCCIRLNEINYTNYNQLSV